MNASPRPGSERYPHCSQCGYVLIGLTESPRCPECGRPLVEVLMRTAPSVETGRRWRSTATLFGLPAIDVAFGPKNGETKGRARGFIAIGDSARGVVAIGGQAIGVVSIGGFSMGLFSLGGLSIGLCTSLGGMSVGGVAAGGGAVGGVAVGGGVIGLVVQGGSALGWFAKGPGAFGMHTIRPWTGAAPSPRAVEVFTAHEWFFGGVNVLNPGWALLWVFATLLAMGAVLTLWGWMAHIRAKRPKHPGAMSPAAKP